MRVLIYLIVLFNSIQFYSQNILEVNDAFESPKANLSDVAWIAGYYTGEALGGNVEEIWLPPMGNSMLGAFKLVENEKVVFYEILTISEENNTLILRLKHFDADLKGWEPQKESVEFKLVKLTKNKVFFNGLTFEKISDSIMHVYVNFNENNSKKEIKFIYNKTSNEF